MVLEPQEELMKKFQSVPKIQVIEKYTPIEESDILTSLVGVDTISIKHALLIDGQEICYEHLIILRLRLISYTKKYQIY